MGYRRGVGPRWSVTTRLNKEMMNGREYGRIHWTEVWTSGTRTWYCGAFFCKAGGEG